MTAEVLTTILSFLQRIGLETVLTEVHDSFLPGIEVVAGRLHVDPVRLRWPGDLLHEAGHLAVVPSAQRGLLSGAIAVQGPAASDHGDAGEVEATAWAYAAIVALGLDPAVLFHEGGYRGQSAELIHTYSLGVYLGVRGLEAAGLTHIRAMENVPAYPHMVRWLRS